MASSLEAKLQEKAKAGPQSSAPKFNPDVLQHVPLELLDDNPWQPRAAMDERALTELVDAIRAQGLIQPIVVRPGLDHRFVIVAGHRRAAAFKRLLGAASTESERQKYAAIPATVKLALDDAQLAAMAYIENVAREALTPLDEARALETMVEKGLAQTAEQLAALVQQPLMRIKRLRRLTAAPKAVKDAINKGLSVEVAAEDGKEKKETRRLELLAAIAFIRAFDHFKKTAPAKAEERTETVVRRALSEGWNLRQCEAYVQRLVDGQADAEPKTPTVALLFVRTAKRFAIDLERLKSATAEQRAALSEALAEFIDPIGGKVQQ